ncbi:TPA: antirestriction protein, partial [Escherichia coli]
MKTVSQNTCTLSASVVTASENDQP